MSEISTVRNSAVAELLDKQAIRDATMRYFRGIDRCDAELISSAYHADARDQRQGQELTGDVVGPTMADSSREHTQSTNHQVGTQLIEIYGDTAACESYSTGTHVLKDGRRLHTIMRYVDRFQLRDGEWKIIHRIVIEELSEVKPPLDVPESRSPSLGRRDRSDPSYTFFRVGHHGA